jgi:hypothetical protein
MGQCAVNWIHIHSYRVKKITKQQKLKINTHLSPLFCVKTKNCYNQEESNMRRYVALSIAFVVLLLSVIVPVNVAGWVESSRQRLGTETVEDIINSLPGQYVNYTNDAHYLDGRLKYRGWWNISYLYYVQPHVINSTQTIVRPEFQSGTFWLTLNKTNRWVVNGTHWWNETWYPAWIETTVKKGTVINFWTGTEKISGSQTIVWNSIPIDTWVIDFTDPHGYEKDLMYFDKQTGVLVTCLTEYTVLGFKENQTLAETNIPIGGHDTAVTNVTPSQTLAYTGYTVIDVVVNVTNHGKFSETFSVTVYYNNTELETQTVTNLAPNANATVTFFWEVIGVSHGYYTISAKATPVAAEIDIADNSLTDGSIMITIPGDINGDKIVTVLDIYALGKAYGATQSSPNWNQNADINNDGAVNELDVATLSAHFGQSW